MKQLTRGGISILQKCKGSILNICDPNNDMLSKFMYRPFISHIGRLPSTSSAAIALCSWFFLIASACDIADSTSGQRDLSVAFPATEVVNVAALTAEALF
jgi:hypothetical protein